MNPASRISDSPKTPREFSIYVIRELRGHGYEAYWAGGCVRDLLRGQNPQDYDVATSARPDQVRQVFGAERTLAVGESFGVMLVRGPRSAGTVEVATFRKDLEYEDGRRPSGVVYCGAQEDALRRDFTINGMFYDPLTETVLDYVNGQQDLAARIVRAIGDPHLRFSEDKLRLLRAARFAALLEFDLEPATAAAARAMHQQIVVVSAERIAQELRKMLAAPHRSGAVALLRELELLKPILPELEDLLTRLPESYWYDLLQALRLLSLNSFTAAMAVLLSDIPAPHGAPSRKGSVHSICQRLKLSNAEHQEILWTIQNRSLLHSPSTRPLAEVKLLLQSPYFETLFAAEQAWTLAQNRDTSDLDWWSEFRRTRSPEQINPPLLLTGDDLIGLGWQPGRELGWLLKELRTAQLNELIQSREEALALLERLRLRYSSGGAGH